MVDSLMVNQSKNQPIHVGQTVITIVDSLMVNIGKNSSPMNPVGLDAFAKSFGRGWVLPKDWFMGDGWKMDSAKKNIGQPDP